MKKLLLLLPLLFTSTPVIAQQVNYTQICTQYREVYIPGGYDYYGYFYPGKVSSERYVVPCNGNVVNYVQPQQQYYQPQQQYYQRQRICNPAAGAAIGYGLGEALGGGNGWKSSSNWTRNYDRNSSSGSYNYSNRNYKSNGWSVFGGGLGALIFGC